MPLDYNCPHCGKYLAIPEQFIGKEGRCNGCQERFVVTRPIESVPFQVDDPAPPPPPVVVQQSSTGSRALIFSAGCFTGALSVIFGMFLFGIGMAGLAVQSVDQAIQDTALDVQPRNSAQATEPPTASGEWSAVTTFTGTGTKKSPPFQITSDQWRIRWNSNPNVDVGGTTIEGHFSASIYDTSQPSFPHEMVQATGTSVDESYIYGDGSYYLQVNSMGDWEIEVEELL